MRKLLLLHALVFLFIYAVAQQEKYSRVKIDLTGSGLNDVINAGISKDDGIFIFGESLYAELSSSQLSLLSNTGIKYEIIIDDLSSYYQKRIEEDKNESDKNKSQYCFSSSVYLTPDHFHLGSMGGSFTLSELLAELDSMRILFPGLISVKQPVDTAYSIEGRPIYYVRISDDPDVDESEPEVLYTALTHAREGAGMMQMIYYMWYLLENYSSDPDIKNLVDNTEMYFVPCNNPDGYVYNEINYPGGGGLWRKSRRDNGDGSFGIDLNRNYGYMWGYDDSGSSPFPSYDTYRGTSAFSEPETRAIKHFCEEHQFRLALNHHTYGNDLINPWGYIGSLYTPDSLVYKRFGEYLSAKNLFIHGTANETIGYITNGSSDDWMYGEQSSKEKIFAFTPESGGPGDGFWPVPSRIPQICRDNIGMNLATAYLAGKYALVEDQSDRYLDQLQGYFSYSIERLGLDSPAIFTVSLQPLTSNIVSVGSQKIYPGMSLREKINDSISFNLDPSIQVGDMIQYLLKINNGLYSHSDTITKFYGPSYIIFSDDCNTINNWTSSSVWDISDENDHSAPYSITDSPYAYYPDQSTTTVESIMPVDMTGALSALLTFWTRWDVESGGDYVEVRISTDNGSTWTPLCGKLSRPCNNFAAEGEPSYSGYQAQWQKEEITLDDYIGNNILIQFELNSDNDYYGDGFYFDDMRILALIDSASSIHEMNSTDIFISDPSPNPSSDESVITYGMGRTSNDFSFIVTDMTGRMVFVKKLNTYNGIIKMNSLLLGSGIYQYCIENSFGRSEVKKMMILN